MPNHLTLTAMAAAIRRKELSPVELAEAHLAQIERVNPQMNAFVQVLGDAAREAARRLETAREEGPLHGVPMTIKDSFDVAGLPTYCGTQLRLEHRARTDSTAAGRLRAAGAVILGKTNCPEFLMNYETDNHITGRTNNPWNLALTPGGSSGGESAAIAAFCSAGGIGSDGGGSIRFPAHCTGIAGLKPTPGRCPATGHYPEIAHPGGLLGVGGPMARTAADLKLLFEVLSGHDPYDPFSAPVLPQTPALDGLRIGVMEQPTDAPIDPSIRAAVRAASNKLADLGFPVQEFRSTVPARAAQLWAFFFKTLPVGVMRPILEGLAPKLHWTGRELWDEVTDEPEPTGTDVLERLSTRDKLRGQLLREMENTRVLLWPAAGVAAFPHRQREWQTPDGPLNYAQAMEPLTPANCLGFPALTIPFGRTPDGLPVGIQLIGRPWEEEALLELAVQLEETRGPVSGPSGC
jgi:amidase